MLQVSTGVFKPAFTLGGLTPGDYHLPGTQKLNEAGVETSEDLRAYLVGELRADMWELARILGRDRDPWNIADQGGVPKPATG